MAGVSFKFVRKQADAKRGVKCATEERAQCLAAQKKAQKRIEEKKAPQRSKELEEMMEAEKSKAANKQAKKDAAQKKASAGFVSRHRRRHKRVSVSVSEHSGATLAQRSALGCAKQTRQWFIPDGRLAPDADHAPARQRRPGVTPVLASFLVSRAA